MRLGGQNSFFIPFSGAEEDGIWKQTLEEAALTVGWLEGLVPAASLFLLLSLLSFLTTVLGCCLSPFPHGAPLGHAAVTGSPLLLAKGLCTCPQSASGDSQGQDMLVAGQGMVLASSTCTVEGLAIGNRAP